MEEDEAKADTKVGCVGSAEHQPLASLQGMFAQNAIEAFVYQGCEERMLTLNFTQNFSMMSEYVSEVGKIQHSKLTGLRPRNQRRMAKAVRRAIGLGLIPTTYRHPEILKTEPDYIRRQRQAL